MRADDWPQYRGPNRDGVWHETGLLQSFPAEGLKIAWRVPVGWGWSSPAVVDGRVFLTDVQFPVSSVKERVVCFEETSGAILWTFAYDVDYPDWARVPGQGGGPSATPSISDGMVYAVGPGAQVHCLDVRTGALVWKRELAREYEIKELSVRPSPLIDGNLLIVFTGGKPGASLIALNKTNGEEVWTSLDDSVSNSSPILIEAGGARQLIVWTDESLASLNPATGAVYWREPMVTSNNDCIPAPVVQGDRMLVGGLMMELSTDRPAATTLWPGINPAGKRILSNTSTAVLSGDYVYSVMANGEFVCLEAATGKQVWKVNTVTSKGAGASAHLTPVGDYTFIFTDRGDLILARLTPEGYKEISRAHLLEPTTPFGGRKFAWTPPAYANRHIFARNDVELVCASLAAE